MLKLDDVGIRKFTEKDVQKKVEWINNPANNKYLHYDLPLTIEGTAAWFERVKDRSDRYDAVIEYNGIPVGLCGLLSIDEKNLKAEGYFILGEEKFLRRGITFKALKLLSYYFFEKLRLNRLYYFTEVINTPAAGLFRKLGLKEEGILEDDIRRGDKFIGRYVFSITAKSYVPDGNITDDE